MAERKSPVSMGRRGWRVVLALLAVGGDRSAWAQPAPTDQPAAKEDDMPDDRPLPLNLNLVMPTMGGKLIWTDEWVRGEYRVQRNVLTGHYRLLDDQDRRLAWGTADQCRTRFMQVIDERQLAPVTGEVVVLLHGLGRSREVMKPVGAYLRERGDLVPIGVNYASTREGIEQHAQALEKIVDQLDQATTIHFVCHSLGNIVLRHYLADLERRPPDARRPPLGRIVMLGPPNNGAQLARKLHATGVFGLVAGRSGESLGHDWEQLAGRLATPAGEFGIVAGGKGNDRGNNPLLSGDDDLVVTVEETRLPGAHDFLQLPLLHSQMLRDRQVHEATLRFLREGHFRKDGPREPIDE